MSGNRGELHRLVDELDERFWLDAAALLRTLSKQRWFQLVGPRGHRELVLLGGVLARSRNSVLLPIPAAP